MNRGYNLPHDGEVVCWNPGLRHCWALEGKEKELNSNTEPIYYLLDFS